MRNFENSLPLNKEELIQFLKDSLKELDRVFAANSSSSTEKAYLFVEKLFQFWQQVLEIVNNLKIVPKSNDASANVFSDLKQLQEQYHFITKDEYAEIKSPVSETNFNARNTRLASAFTEVSKLMYGGESGGGETKGNKFVTDILEILRAGLTNFLNLYKIVKDELIEKEDLIAKNLAEKTIRLLIIKHYIAAQTYLPFAVKEKIEQTASFHEILKILNLVKKAKHGGYTEVDDEFIQLQIAKIEIYRLYEATELFTKHKDLFNENQVLVLQENITKRYNDKSLQEFKENIKTIREDILKPLDNLYTEAKNNWDENFKKAKNGDEEANKKVDQAIKDLLVLAQFVHEKSFNALGIVAVKQQDYQAAQQWFELVYLLARDDELKKVALKNLKKCTYDLHKQHDKDVQKKKKNRMNTRKTDGTPIKLKAKLSRDTLEVLDPVMLVSFCKLFLNKYLLAKKLNLKQTVEENGLPSNLNEALNFYGRLRGCDKDNSALDTIKEKLIEIDNELGNQLVVTKLQELSAKEDSETKIIKQAIASEEKERNTPLYIRTKPEPDQTATPETSTLTSNKPRGLERKSHFYGKPPAPEDSLLKGENKSPSTWAKAKPVAQQQTAKFFNIEKGKTEAKAKDDDQKNKEESKQSPSVVTPWSRAKPEALHQQSKENDSIITGEEKSTIINDI